MVGTIGNPTAVVEFENTKDDSKINPTTYIGHLPKFVVSHLTRKQVNRVNQLHTDKHTQIVEVQCTCKL